MRFSVFGAVLALACVGLSAAPAAFGPRTAADQGLRFDGEYGLRVVHDRDSVRVAWITGDSVPGALEVLDGQRVRQQATTPAGFAHAVRFAHRGGGTLLLRYGTAAGDRHETTVRLDPPRRPPVELAAVDSLFVMGDIHGEYDTLTATLRNAGLIDARGRWAGGRAHLAVVGDMTDRGADVNRVLWFLYGLEPQAERAGGRLHVLLGNHEIMVMLDDLRYVHPKELELAHRHRVTYDRLFDPRRSILGAWLASKPALVRVGDVLLAHGGVATDWLDYTPRSYDDTLAAFVAEDWFYRWADTTYVVPLDSTSFQRRLDFFSDENSVFWYRGYAQSDTLADALTAVLRRYNAAIHVVGHTPSRTMHTRYDGRLIAVNTVPFAAELLLLERSAEGYRRWRFRTGGPAERF